MANPVFLLNSASQKVPSLVKADGTVLRPLAIGQVGTTYTGDGGWEGVATHTEGATPGATDGYVAIMGYDGTVMRRVLVDTTGRILMDTQTRRKSITAVPALVGSGVYAAKDAIGTLLTFAAAGRATVLSGLIEQVVIADKAQQITHPLELVLFSTSIVAPTDNVGFDPTDAELLTCIGVIPIAAADFKDYFDNSVAVVPVDRPYVLAGTSMYGVLVARGTPTYVSTTDLQVTLFVRTD